MDDLNSICPSDLVIIGTLLTFLISDDRDAGELNVLGNLIVSVGSLVLTWAAQKELLKTSEDTNTTKDTVSLDDIKNQIKCLQDKCERLEHSSTPHKK
ncbi:MAG: hypothetical protein K0Q85_939 [Caproiciproducens sp.]|jgi:hypothetical protein|nr:hypothetical protein [Caproiciproducens sp.]